MATVSRFLRNESGATVLEYSLIAAGVSLAIATSLNGLAEKFSELAGRIIAALN